MMFQSTKQLNSECNVVVPVETASHIYYTGNGHQARGV